MWIWAVLYSAGIVYLSSKTNPPVPDAIFRINDKVLHFIQYAIFGILWRGALAQRFRLSNDFRKSHKMALLLGMLFAALDELHQSFVPGRDSDVMDFIADAIGIVTGTWVISWLHWRHLK